MITLDRVLGYLVDTPDLGLVLGGKVTLGMLLRSLHVK